MSSSSPENSLKNKLVLITGASGGIGRAIASQLVLHDCDLALHYSSNALAVEELAAQLRHDYETHRPGSERYLRITCHKADVEVADEVVGLVREVEERQGRGVDVLVSNAGRGKRIVDIWDIPLEEFQKTITVNLTASFLLVKSCVEHMKSKNWGRIIFVSSISAKGVGINGCHYAASKGGLTSMMKNLASKLAPYGITVNDVAPAMIGNTGMIPNTSVEGLPDLPLGRLGYPEEVANVVTMFATTGYATGQSFLLAGGLNHK